ncbi:MAG TPA: CHASE sensor domain-containing protein [Stellaceae bacterium]
MGYAAMVWSRFRPRSGHRSTVSAALSFDDRATAAEYVAALAADPGIRAVGIYDCSGALFAGIGAPARTICRQRFAGRRIAAPPPTG